MLRLSIQSQQLCHVTGTYRKKIAPLLDAQGDSSVSLKRICNVLEGDRVIVLSGVNECFLFQDEFTFEACKICLQSTALN